MTTPDIFVNASPRAILIEAAGFVKAKVGFSPIVTTSPSFDVKDLKLIE